MPAQQVQDKQNITPFLWFDKNAEEAMNFYTSVFPKSRIVSISRYPAGGKSPMEGMDGKVLTAVFELMGQTFMCLDGGPFFKPTGAVSFYVECKTQEEVDKYWNALSANPEAQQCGWLQDKYGFSWQIIPEALPRLLNDPDKAKADRVLQAMLKMKKIIVADLEKAANG
jgi:predicted 3-demethylubiquinone-9 3-methyltransferase (glyoxalase superfamily)